MPELHNDETIPRDVLAEIKVCLDWSSRYSLSPSRRQLRRLLVEYDVAVAEALVKAWRQGMILSREADEERRTGQ
jgi:hypothetical protein